MDNRLEYVIEKSVYDIASNSYDMTFLDEESISYILKDEGVENVLLQLKNDGPCNVQNEFEFLFDNISNDDLEPEEMFEEFKNSVNRLIEEFEKRKIVNAYEKDEFIKVLHDAEEKFNTFLLEREDSSADYGEDLQYSGYTNESPSEKVNTTDIFSDVDL